MKCKFSMDDIINYAEQNISADQAEAIKEHLSVCKKCRDYYNVLTVSEGLTRSIIKKNDSIEEKVIDAIDKNRYKKGRFLYNLGRFAYKSSPVLKAAAAITVAFTLVFFILANRSNSPQILSSNETASPTVTEPPYTSAVPTGQNNPAIVTEKKIITVYFGNSDADAVVPEKREVSVKTGEALEKIVFEELQNGPASGNLYPVIPNETRLLSVHTQNGICTLDLSKEFVDNNIGGTAGEAMTLYSIINSLTELPGVEKVQFLIEGQKRDVYTHSVFNEPFSRNESLIKYPDSNNTEQAVRNRANEALAALKNRDMAKLSSLVHPDKGVRFSPYTYVDNKHMVFTGEQIKDIYSNEKKYLWGSYDGSGEPIELTFHNYFNKFVYDKDFSSAPQIGYNQILREGNTKVNIKEFYPEGIFVEYHFPGFDQQYAGMDWVSLRLVFENKDGVWYLVGVVHDQWTI